MALADSNDAVITLADGSKVTASGKVIRPDALLNAVEVPSNTELQRRAIKANKQLMDLPGLPQQMNAISVILTYTLYGLIDQDISVATGLDVEQIERIRESDAYTKLLEEVTKNITAQDSETIRGLINQKATTAVTKVVALMDSEDDKVALSAAKDVLDRAGHRPADVVEHRHRVDAALRIEVIKRDESKSMPTLDLKGTEV